MDFKIKITDIDIFGLRERLGLVGEYDKLDIDTNSPEATIEYDIDIEAREWGIKYIGISIKRVSVSINWIVDEEDTTVSERLKLESICDNYDSYFKVYTGVIELNTETDKDWELNHSLVFSESGSMSPENVQIDFKGKQICVN